VKHLVMVSTTITKFVTSHWKRSRMLPSNCLIGQAKKISITTFK